MALWPSPFGDEVVLRSIDWIENFPWRNESAVKKGHDKYEISLHVKDFAPDHIKVKIIDGYVVVEGKHDEIKDEYGYISRSFVRKYPLTEGCRTEAIESRLSAEGILTITIPRKIVMKRDTVIPVSYENSKTKSKL